MPTNMSATAEFQCFLFSRNIGYVTPKIIYFYDLKTFFLDQSIQKTIFFKFENGSTAEFPSLSRSHPAGIPITCYSLHYDQLLFAGANALLVSRSGKLHADQMPATVEPTQLLVDLTPQVSHPLFIPLCPVTACCG